MKERFIPVNENIIQCFIKDLLLLKQTPQKAVLDQEYVNNKTLLIHTMGDINEVFFICSDLPNISEKLDTVINFIYIYPSRSKESINSKRDIAIFLNKTYDAEINVEMYSNGNNLYQSIYKVEIPRAYNEKDYMRYNLFTWFKIWESKQNLFWFVSQLGRAFNKKISFFVIRSLISAIYENNSFIFLYTIYKN